MRVMKMEKEERTRLLREKIGALDGEILHLLNERAEIALEMGKVKSEAGITLYDPQREEEILKQLAS